MTDCACKYNEYDALLEVCRSCAAVIPQTIEDDRGRLQLNPDWLQARCAFVTGSRVADVIRTTQKGWSTSRAKYMDHLLAERLTGKPQGIRKIYSLDERRDLEPEARAAYAFYHNQDVKQVGFIHHLFIERFGCSPDGLCGDDGMIEIKCLDACNHLRLWEGDESVIEEYKPQVRAGLSCTSREWCDWVSYNPQMLDEDKKLFVRRFWRNEDDISRLECAVKDFLAEVETRLKTIRNGGNDLAAQLTGSIAMIEKPSKVMQMKSR